MKRDKFSISWNSYSSGRRQTINKQITCCAKKSKRNRIGRQNKWSWGQYFLQGGQGKPSCGTVTSEQSPKAGEDWTLQIHMGKTHKVEGTASAVPPMAYVKVSEEAKMAGAEGFKSAVGDEAVGWWRAVRSAVQVWTACHSLIRKVLLTYVYLHSCTTSAQGEDQHRP